MFYQRPGGGREAVSRRRAEQLQWGTGGGYTGSQQQKKKPALIGAGWLYPQPLARLGDGGR